MDKVSTLGAAADLVRSGSSIAIGGFGVYGHPMAFLRQLVRSKDSGLTVMGFTSGLDIDFLCSANRVSQVETSTVSLESFGLAPNFRRAVEAGQVKVRDYTESMMYHRFWAASQGLTFFPTRVPLGSDIIRYNPDLTKMNCPLTGRPYMAMSPARPQFAVFHVPYADADGNAAFPRPGAFGGIDRVMAMAADGIILTCERIVPNEDITRLSEFLFVPGYKVLAVVEVPMGAHPGGLGDYYVNDEQHLRDYAALAREPDMFNKYLDRYVYGCPDHQQYLETVGASRVLAIHTGEGVRAL